MIAPRVGWDPIFEYEGNTFAEMDKDEKVGREKGVQPCLPNAGLSENISDRIDAECLQQSRTLSPIDTRRLRS